jgi:hypothetical protein
MNKGYVHGYDRRENKGPDQQKGRDELPCRHREDREDRQEAKCDPRGPDHGHASQAVGEQAEGELAQPVAKE